MKPQNPAGFPRSRRITVPSAVTIDAASHRFTYKMIHGWSVLASTALTMRSHGTLSKNLAMSMSTTQSIC